MSTTKRETLQQSLDDIASQLDTLNEEIEDRVKRRVALHGLRLKTVELLNKVRDVELKAENGE